MRDLLRPERLRQHLEFHQPGQVIRDLVEAVIELLEPTELAVPCTFRCDVCGTVARGAPVKRDANVDQPLILFTPPGTWFLHHRTGMLACGRECAERMNGAPAPSATQASDLDELPPAPPGREVG